MWLHNMVDSKSAGSKPCSSCDGFFLRKEGHSKCLFFLGESHMQSRCWICISLSARTCKSCDAWLKSLHLEQSVSIPSDSEETSTRVLTTDKQTSSRALSSRQATAKTIPEKTAPRKDLALTPVLKSNPLALQTLTLPLSKYGTKRSHPRHRSRDSRQILGPDF